MNTQEKIKQWEQDAAPALFQGLGLPEDAKILDYGCGFGHYTFAAARALGGKGEVYAVDINKWCLTHISRKAKDEGLTNIIMQTGNRDYSLKFDDGFFDMILYYDLFHGSGQHRFILLEEAARTLKAGGILSVLPFHLSNFRDKRGMKKIYTYPKVIAEIEASGFVRAEGIHREGVHFDKVHSLHYMSQGSIEFEELERAEILTFRKE
ncbi:class I SAM-dependent methyltransferase [Gorillibacterium massiliense]|uniref:class I SAM-dependent methyltransferase n=1 Tax=Gorillibacterium massiliense TaxID=1280390 RepID=UPI0004B5F1C8|nr:class I SAM-dependent methyltransferase [Gorillibacterium massiliense]